MCDYLVEGTRFIGGVTGKSYIINSDMGCNSDHVIYLISCARCAMQYVGSTINKFRIRFNNHKSRLNSHVKLTAENRVKGDIIYKSFTNKDEISASLISSIFVVLYIYIYIYMYVYICIYIYTKHKTHLDSKRREKSLSN